jgi:hypothetical protein
MKIKIVDNREYVSGKSCNGGCYSFTKIFEQVELDRYKVVYSTSSEFDYCSRCGEFGSNHHYIGDYLMYHCDIEYVNQSNIIAEIDSYKEDKNCLIYTSIYTTNVEESSRGEIVFEFVIENKYVEELDDLNLIDEVVE